MEYRLRRHDRVYRWMRDRGTPRFSPTGEFQGIVGSLTDITEQKGNDVSWLAKEVESKNLKKTAEQADEAAPLCAGAAGKLSLWLVVDNVEFLQMCNGILHRDCGLECVRHFDTAEAVIEALREAPGPAWMLLDVSLTGMSGVMAVKAIKSLSPGTQVLVFSTLFDAQCAAEAKSGGVSGFLRKSDPFDQTKKTLWTAASVSASCCQLMRPKHGSASGFELSPGHPAEPHIDVGPDCERTAS